MRLTPDLLRMAYARGIFPMAESADDPTLAWFDPDPRGIIPLDRFHVPASLAKRIKRGEFTVDVDRDFDAVIRACAAQTPTRRSTWINEEIIAAYGALHDQGAAHSVECRVDGVLVGGLYGVALGGAFFGESMFSRATDASKVALAHLVERLRAGGFMLLDTQFVTPHLARFGAVEIPRTAYRRLLARALVAPADFRHPPASCSR